MELAPPKEQLNAVPEQSFDGNDSIANISCSAEEVCEQGDSLKELEPRRSFLLKRSNSMARRSASGVGAPLLIDVHKLSSGTEHTTTSMPAPRMMVARANSFRAPPPRRGMLSRASSTTAGGGGPLRGSGLARSHSMSRPGLERQHSSRAPPTRRLPPGRTFSTDGALRGYRRDANVPLARDESSRSLMKDMLDDGKSVGTAVSDLDSYGPDSVHLRKSQIADPLYYGDDDDDGNTYAYVETDSVACHDSVYDMMSLASGYSNLAGGGVAPLREYLPEGYGSAGGGKDLAVRNRSSSVPVNVEQHDNGGPSSSNTGTDFTELSNDHSFSSMGDFSEGDELLDDVDNVLLEEDDDEDEEDDE